MPMFVEIASPGTTLVTSAFPICGARSAWAARCGTRRGGSRDPRGTFRAPLPAATAAPAAAAAPAALQGALWQGNVRELINRVRRAIILAEGPLVRAEDLGLAPTRPWPRPAPLPATLREARRTAKVECIL